MAALLLRVVVPTGAVALGVRFSTVPPVGVGAWLCSAAGLALWLRSSVAMMIVETAEATHRERLADHERGERLVEQFSR